MVDAESMDYVTSSSLKPEFMDSEYGTGTNVEHPRRHKKANGNKYEVRNPLAESEDERENVRHPKIHQGIAVSGVMVAPTKRLKSLSSGSSSASDCSSEDFIQLDPKVINTRASATAPFPDHVRPLPIYYKTDLSSDASSKSDSRASATATAPFPNHVRPLPIYYKTDLSSDASSKSERDSRLSTGDCSQVSGITQESLSYSPSVTESPPVQLMERPSGFDPNRIPPSVFARKTPSPMDWSVTSNESLFSIQIGNNSFSRDRVPKLTGELHMTGELETSRNPYTSDISFSPTPPVAQQKESERKKINLGREFEETEKAIIETPVETFYVQGKGNYPAQEMSFNHHSDRRELQIQTVVFPQKKKHEKSSWSCSNCSCGFCCSTRRSCCLCKRPSCKCCKLPSCNNCCKKPSCSCCKWPSCSSCCKCPSCSSCCNWPSCSGCSRPSSRCCKWSNCSCCKCLSCSGCCQPSCSCKWPSCNCCNWPSCSCSACRSCSGCSCAFCCCWSSRRKRTILTEGRYAEPKSSKRWYSCFLC